MILIDLGVFYILNIIENKYLGHKKKYRDYKEREYEKKNHNNK